MRFECALQGEDADGEGWLGHVFIVEKRAGLV
jgi:hypothetical protein